VGYTAADSYIRTSIVANEAWVNAEVPYQEAALLESTKSIDGQLRPA
jgi:hypothetical protein